MLVKSEEMMTIELLSFPGFSENLSVPVFLLNSEWGAFVDEKTQLIEDTILESIQQSNGSSHCTHQILIGQLLDGVRSISRRGGIPSLCQRGIGQSKSIV